MSTQHTNATHTNDWQKWRHTQKNNDVTHKKNSKKEFLPDLKNDGYKTLKEPAIK
jgi:hypothetical protein